MPYLLEMKVFGQWQLVQSVSSLKEGMDIVVKMGSFDFRIYCGPDYKYLVKVIEDAPDNFILKWE